MSWTKISDEPDLNPPPPSTTATKANFVPLACAVLAKAFEDLRTGGGWNYADAKAFLCNPGPDLDLWCNLAGFNQQAVVERARRIEATPATPGSETRRH